MRTLRVSVAVVALLLILPVALCVPSIAFLSFALMLATGTRVFSELWQQQPDAAPMLLIAAMSLLVAGVGVFVWMGRRYIRFVRRREFARPDDPWPLGERSWRQLLPWASRGSSSPPVTWSAVLIAMVGLASAGAVTALVLVGMMCLEAVIIGGAPLLRTLFATLSEPLRESYWTVMVSVLVGCVAGIPAWAFVWYWLASHVFRTTPQEMLDLLDRPK